MKILVCIKQVLSKEESLEIDPSGRSIITGRSPLYQLNTFDEYALEAALQVREGFPETGVDILSLGPARVEAVIRRGLGMGADEGIHLLAEEAMVPDPFQLSSWIAANIKERPYDLILTGFLAEDDLEGQMGPLLAERLGLPCSASVVALELFPEERQALVEREVEGGLREKWRLPLPAVLTIQSGINKPRYPSLSHVLRARKQTLECVPVPSLETVEPRRTVVRYLYPEKVRAGIMLQGTPREKAENLTARFLEKGLLT
ncbi:MAG: electron transfer flavoprotein subunit beta/FixA family protein [Deltaproteobacteria bacterium]|nr:electron transfer flavoprotein subunit beta/FixA family protein [Deltaproteobacteria bacterium]